MQSMSLFVFCFRNAQLDKRYIHMYVHILVSTHTYTCICMRVCVCAYHAVHSNAVAYDAAAPHSASATGSAAVLLCVQITN